MLFLIKNNYVVYRGVALSSVPRTHSCRRGCVSDCRAYLDSSRGVCNCIKIVRDSWSNPLGLSLNGSVTSAPMAIYVRAKMIKVGMPCPSHQKQSMFIAFWLFPRPCCACRSIYFPTIIQCIYAYIKLYKLQVLLAA